MGNPVADRYRYKSYSYYSNVAYNDIYVLQVELNRVKAAVRALTHNIDVYSNSILTYASNAVNYVRQGCQKMEKADQNYKRHYKGTDSAREKTEKIERHLEQYKTVFEKASSFKEMIEANIQLLQKELSVQQSYIPDINNVIYSIRRKAGML